MKERFITIADYAERLGISIKDARKILSKPDFIDFYKIVNGKELVSTSIPDYKEHTENTAKEQPEEEKTETADTTAAADEVERLYKEIEDLKETIKEKDRQIADFALRFADLAQQAQQIAGQAQVLQLSDKTKAVGEIETTTAADDVASQQKPGFFRRLFGF
jgi:predicted RNase H-like nuclease (RuvC/YqgF family)